ncbi:MAG: porin [Bacteroidales bacterium]
MKKTLSILIILTFFVSVQISAQGCMEPASSSGGVSVIGYIQPEFKIAFNGNNVDGTSKNDMGFYFRRARLGVTGVIPYDFSYYVMAEFSTFQKGPYMLDAFLTYNRFKPWLKISMGQFKKPFGLELGSTACQDLYTINRSKVVNELTSPDRDLGIMISGSTGPKKLLGLEKENILSYSLSVTNGTGKNTYDIDMAKDFIGRLVIAPYDWVSIGGSYQYGKQKNPDPTVTSKDIRMRYGFDVTLKKYNFILQSEYVFGRDEGSKLIGGGCGATPELVLGNFKSNGYFAQLMYNTKFKVMPLVKYETYDSDMDKEDYDHTAYRNSTLTFGLNYYANDWVRFQLNYLYNIESSSSTDIVNYNEIPNDMFLMQIQVKLN